MQDVTPYTVVAIVVTLVFVIWLITFIVKKRHEKIVYRTSGRLKKLSDENDRYRFNEGIRDEYGYEISLQTKGKYDRFDLPELFDMVVWEKEEVRDAADRVLENRRLYEEYKNEADELESEITEEEAKKLHIGYNTYKKTEQRLFENILKKPVLQSKVVCTAKYTSPKGRNSYNKADNFDITLVPARYVVLQQSALLQSSEERRRQRARSQMTDKLRYSILKRDGFRCKLCGRSVEDGVKLHVDHIVPVSKGGETTWDNLRTLCDECNLGKSDEIE